MPRILGIRQYLLANRPLDPQDQSSLRYCTLSGITGIQNTLSGITGIRNTLSEITGIDKNFYLEALSNIRSPRLLQLAMDCKGYRSQSACLLAFY